MGVLIVAIVGAIMGWLVSIVLDRRAPSTLAIALSGAGGAIVGALLVREVPLSLGLSPTQLLSAALGAAIAIVITVVAAYRSRQRDRRSI